MKNSFEKILDFIFEVEGIKSDHGSDKGGLTKWGIASRWYPEVAKDDFAIDDARLIYKSQYWDKCRCFDMPFAVATIVMDIAVNSGPKDGGRLVQEGINLSGGNVGVDGWVGDKTIDELWSVDIGKLVKVLIALRLRHYRKVIKKDRSQIDFLSGWVLRVEKLLLFIA